MTFREYVDIASKIFGMLAGLFAIGSVIIAFKNYNHNRKRAAKDKACELARFFETEILETASFVLQALMLPAKERLIKAFPSDKIKSFDHDEMSGLLKQAGIKPEDAQSIFSKVDDADGNIIFSYLFKKANTEIERERVLLHIKKPLSPPVPPDGAPPKIVLNGETLADELRSAITALLNKLEWFAMYFYLNVADEDAVYQSLHQNYLAVVNVLYYRIASVNKDNGDKYYTNIIELYNLWSDRLRARNEKQAKALKKAKLPPHKPKKLK